MTVGIHPGLVVANFVIPPDQVTLFAQARRNMQVKYLAEIRERFAVPVLEIPLLPHEVKGLEMLTELGELAYGQEKITVR
jgi:arsenite-transporting ATPase